MLELTSSTDLGLAAAPLPYCNAFEQILRAVYVAPSSVCYSEVYNIVIEGCSLRCMNTTNKGGLRQL